MVYDFDSILGFPVDFDFYFAKGLANNYSISSRLQRFVIVSVYLINYFHMNDLITRKLIMFKVFLIYMINYTVFAIV